MRITVVFCILFFGNAFSKKLSGMIRNIIVSCILFAGVVALCLDVDSYWPTAVTLANLPEWLAVVAELLVAAAIYFELEHNRQVSFLAKATSEDMNRARGEIYEAYVNLGHFDCLKKRSVAFVDGLQTAPRLTQLCDTQLVLFNELGYIASPRWSQTADLVELFPHAPIFIWVILEPYIVRRQKDSGDWYAKHFKKFTEKCLDYVLQTKDKTKGSLYLRLSDHPDKNVKFSWCYLKTLKRQLEGDATASNCAAHLSPIAPGETPPKARSTSQ